MYFSIIIRNTGTGLQFVLDISAFFLSYTDISGRILTAAIPYVRS
jgi:hypothetical protein